MGRRLGVSTRTAYSLVSDGEVPVIRLRGVLRVPASALEKWLVDREEEALRAVRSD
jgi:excisionase family DNA binding protein